MLIRKGIQTALLLALVMGATSAQAATAAAIAGYPYNIGQYSNFDSYAGGRIGNISTTTAYPWRMTACVDSRYYQTFVSVRANATTAPVSCQVCTVTAGGVESCGTLYSTTSTTAVTLSLGVFLVPSSGGTLLWKCNIGARGEVLSYRWE